MFNKELLSMFGRHIDKNGAIYRLDENDEKVYTTSEDKKLYIAEMSLNLAPTIKDGVVVKNFKVFNPLAPTKPRVNESVDIVKGLAGRSFERKFLVALEHVIDTTLSGGGNPGIANALAEVSKTLGKSKKLIDSKTKDILKKFFGSTDPIEQESRRVVKIGYKDMRNAEDKNVGLTTLLWLVPEVDEDLREKDKLLLDGLLTHVFGSFYGSKELSVVSNSDNNGVVSLLRTIVGIADQMNDSLIFIGLQEDIKYELLDLTNVEEEIKSSTRFETETPPTKKKKTSFGRNPVDDFGRNDKDDQDNRDDRYDNDDFHRNMIVDKEEDSSDNDDNINDRISDAFSTGEKKRGYRDDEGRLVEYCSRRNYDYIDDDRKYVKYVKDNRNSRRSSRDRWGNDDYDDDYDDGRDSRNSWSDYDDYDDYDDRRNYRGRHSDNRRDPRNSGRKYRDDRGSGRKNSGGRNRSNKWGNVAKLDI